MTQFNDFLLLLDSNLSGSWWFPILLVGTGIFFTIYLGFPQFRFFGKAWKLVSGKNNKSDEEGETTGFEALTTAMSGAVGTGNIGGVALAIWTGGPAAIFWMWITAIFGMTTKFVEVTMGHKYRTKLDDGSISGGPMYYIEHALNMKWAGILFAFLMMITAIGSGNMPQINNIALVMNTEFSVPKLFTGLFLGALLWVIIIGGIKRIASVASKIIPIMGLIYFGGALIILIENYQNIIPSFNAIFSQVFTGSAAVGGFLGASFAMSLKYGVARGCISNEAGQGSSPIAHASSKNTSIDQGVVSILEPFIDTIVVCSVTALVIYQAEFGHRNLIPHLPKQIWLFLMVFILMKKISDGTYVHPGHINELTNYVQSLDSDVKEYSGTIYIEDGTIIDSDITVLHSRSIAEDIKVIKNDKNLYTGTLNIVDGKILESVLLEGKSLVSSAELTAKAFSQGILGEYGGKLVAIALLLFAFSTAITWCYYGDRSTAYIFGERGVFGIGTFMFYVLFSRCN